MSANLERPSLLHPYAIFKGGHGTVSRERIQIKFRAHLEYSMTFSIAMMFIQYNRLVLPSLEISQATGLGLVAIGL